MATTLTPAPQRDVTAHGPTEEFRCPSPRPSRSDGDVTAGPVLTPRFVVAIAAGGRSASPGSSTTTWWSASTRPRSRPRRPAARRSWPTSATGTTRSGSACSCSASRSRPTRAPRSAAAAASWSACSSCFLIGLLWICTYYVFSNDPSGDPGHERPRQYNLVARHRLHGRRLHLRHPLGVTSGPAFRPWGPRAAGRATCSCWSSSARRCWLGSWQCGRAAGHARRRRRPRPDPRRAGAADRACSAPTTRSPATGSGSR